MLSHREPTRLTLSRILLVATIFMIIAWPTARHTYGIVLFFAITIFLLVGLIIADWCNFDLTKLFSKKTPGQEDLPASEKTRHDGDDFW